MKKLHSLIVILVLLLAVPLASQAMSHGKGEMDHDKMDMKHGEQSKMDHGKMKMDHDKKEMDHGKMDHGGMDMSGDMIMLGDATEDGVKAMAHLKDVGAAMAKMGMPSTHHIMINFVDLASGKPIESGVAAVKIEGPNGELSEPVKLMGMQGHFGADIELPVAGEYEFKVGTKLADGKKRQFEFKFQLR